MLQNLSSFLLIACLFHYSPVMGEDEKQSLVFVIDDTGSMMDDIDEVKTQVDSIFDAALKSNSTFIEDFIIVTFNDPGVKHRTTTKDREVFKKTLADIHVDGGDDCPEMALTGLELALENSRNGSLVYLFTDADAKDFDKLNYSRKLAQEKSVRINFVLTGTCAFFGYGEKPGGNDNNDPGHRVFFDLAEATNGQVFSIFKKEVGQILGHARAFSSGGYSSTILSEASPPVASAGSGRPGPLSDYIPSSTSTYNFDVSDDVEEILVSVSGDNPTVEISGPGGIVPKTEDVATTSGSKVLKILEAKPGKYVATVTSAGRSSIVVSGRTKSGSTKTF